MNKIIKRIFAIAIILIIFLQYSQVFGYSKNETVFMNVDSTGNAKNAIVNNHLKLNRNEYNSKLDDQTELKEIVNINGEEKFTLNGNLMQWETMSRDIYYQGNSEKVVPITISMKYYLDGEEKKLDEMQGKKGKITIEINYKNNLKNGNLYTPFVVVCGTMISNDSNSEFEITNGKTLDTGTKTILAAIASPGLYDSIGLKEFKELDSVKISYVTEKFEKNQEIYMVASPKLIEDDDLEIFDKIDKLSGNIYELQKNMNTIEAGAKELKEGTSTLEQGTKKLELGTKTVDIGAKNLANGTSNLKQGAESLSNGAKDLNSGISDVSTGIKTISSKLQEIISGVEKLEIGGKNLDNGLEQIIENVKEAKIMFESNEAKMMINNLTYLKNQNKNMVKVIENAYKDNNLDKMTIDTILENQMLTNEQKANLITIKNNYENNNGGLIKLLEGNANAFDGVLQNLNNIKEKLNNLELVLEKAKSGSSQISSGLTDLKNGLTLIHNGSTSLSAGAQKLKSGANILQSGANELNNGANTIHLGSNKLAKGISELSNGASSIASGSNSISNGANELSNGISKFNKEGINKLTSYADRINNYSDIIKKLISLSKEYKGYSCNNANITNFVYSVK